MLDVGASFQRFVFEPFHRDLTDGKCFYRDENCLLAFVESETLWAFPKINSTSKDCWRHSQAHFAPSLHCLCNVALLF